MVTAKPEGRAWKAEGRVEKGQIGWSSNCRDIQRIKFRQRYFLYEWMDVWMEVGLTKKKNHFFSQAPIPLFARHFLSVFPIDNDWLYGDVTNQISTNTRTKRFSKLCADRSRVGTPIKSSSLAKKRKKKEESYNGVLVLELRTSKEATCQRPRRPYIGSERIRPNTRQKGYALNLRAPKKNEFFF